MGSCWRLGPGKEGGGVSFRSVGSGVRAPGSELAPLTCAPAGQQPSPSPQCCPRVPPPPCHKSSLSEVEVPDLSPM